MKNVKVVIGANFGDEGKGLLVDYFASKATRSCVVRFNGGAQAGHTVTTPDGKRHIFSHFGSGTLAGLSTYLSKFFVVNPLLFMQEYKIIKELDITPIVHIDFKCLVSTPYDMIINQIVESARGAGRHGSCGVGFNETIVRSQQEAYCIYLEDLFDIPTLIDKLNAIRKVYLPIRLKELGIESIPDNYVKHIASEAILNKYLEDVKSMLELSCGGTPEMISLYDTIIFEGAQGLLLDQDSEYFPHVTHSSTGMKNVVEILKDMDKYEHMEIVYVTRAYMTRHGAGPFPSEVKEKPYDGIVDLTNVPNTYQGTLRYGILDVDLLLKSIKKDLEYAEGFKYRKRIAITCLDQVGEKVSFIANSITHTVATEDMGAHIWGFGGPLDFYTSYGPTRETIKEYSL